MNISIIGAGAWGTALGLLAHQNGHSVSIWGHDPAHLQETQAHAENRRHLPGIPLPNSWAYTESLSQAAHAADVLVIAVPSRAFREVTQKLSSFQGTTVSVTKGIEFSTGLTMCGILNATTPQAQSAALSGPSLALEVARGVPTAVVAASHHDPIARQVQAVFHRPSFRVYTSTDLIGVELGGALKNVIAIAAGVCDGLGFGDNAKAALITRGKAEMHRLGIACGARGETFSGLSGLGDLTVTCFSRLSRNRNFGERIGRGEKPEALIASGKHMVEGYPTARSAHQLASNRGVQAPITAEVFAMLYEQKDPRQAVVDLLSRDSKAED